MNHVEDDEDDDEKKSMNEIERKEQKYQLCERVKREEDPDEEC